MEFMLENVKIIDFAGCENVDEKPVEECLATISASLDCVCLCLHCSSVVIAPLYIEPELYAKLFPVNLAPNFIVKVVGF